MDITPIIGRYGSWDAGFTAKIEKILDELANLDRLTDLCGIMKRQGSDKGADRHNYTKLYHALLKDRRNKAMNIFEVGLGTNNAEVPSSMGVEGVPGASLRGWREYFPKAAVAGADIDKRILFQDDRIKTYFVDQLDKATIQALWSEIPEKFDLIIDDGLHTFEANSVFTSNSFHKLKKGGYFIIEDIVDHNLNLMLFDAFLRGFRQPAALIRLPHATNSVDNIIALISA